MDAADGSPIRNQQLSYIDMFGYIRRDSETRPSGYSSVTLPTNPAPSYDSGVGYTNSTLHFGLVYWGLTPQQQPGSYQGGEMMMKSVFWWRKPEYPEETTDLRQVTDETFHT